MNTRFPQMPLFMSITVVWIFAVLAVGAEATERVASSNEQILLRAETAFAAGKSHLNNPDRARMHFREAAKMYAALNDLGFRNVELFRNLGNAEFLAGRLPHAILAWRKGLDLAPGDLMLRHNLDYARRQVAYPPDSSVQPPHFLLPIGLPFPSAQLVTTALLLFWLLACLGFTRWFMVRRRAWILGSICSMAVAAILGLWLAAVHIAGLRNQSHPVVVVSSPGVTLHTGNGESYPPHKDIAALQRGMEARLLFRRSDWLQIEFASGQVGWIRESAVILDE